MFLSDRRHFKVRDLRGGWRLGLALALTMASGMGLGLRVSAQNAPAPAVNGAAPVVVPPNKPDSSNPPEVNPAVAATPTASITEENLFKAASKALEDGGALLENAEQDFAAFIDQFPQSPRVPAAVLGQAQSHFKRGKEKEARELLAGRIAAAGKLTDEYLYWIAECDFRLGKFDEAEKGFAQLLRDYPGSARALEASYGQGEVLLKRKKYPAVIKLLNDPDGVFRTQSSLRPKDEIGVLGLLTLGEALLAGGRRQEYEGALRSELNHRIDSVDTANIELHWRWRHLEYRNAMAGDQVDKALGYAESLINLAGEMVDKEWLGESVFRKAEALIKLGRVDDAVNAYQDALNPKMPRHWQRQALDQIVVLRISQKKNAESIAFLGQIVTNFPTAPDLDLLHLTIGEISLGEFSDSRTAEVQVSPALLANTTNYLGLARSQFDLLITNFPSSARLDRAFLHRGECFEFAGQDALALRDFSQAAARAEAATNRVLQARAIFKMGDANFKLTNHLAAVTSYQRSLDEFGDLPEVKNGFGSRAIYQMATAAARLNDLHLAQTALKRMRGDYPATEFYGRAALLVGQALNDAGRHDLALTVFSNCITDFEKKAVELPLRSELTLASSVTHSYKGDYAKGIDAVGAWLASDDNKNHPLLPRAQFELGRLYSNAGQLSNAFGVYTHFVVSHRTNQLSSFARQWLADYYFSKIAEDDNNAPIAEKYYQIIFQTTNWPASELTYRARFMAGQCAMTRQGWNEARDYFSALAGDKEAPDEWRARAYFAIGDVIIHDPQGDRVERWSRAINVFNAIVGGFTNTTLHPLALGRLGHCNFQKGSLVNKKHYDDAMVFYQRVIDHPAADAAALSEAKYALGIALQTKARLQDPADKKLLAAARDQWREVYHFEKLNLERPDPYWLERATIAFAESLIEDGDAKTSVSVLRRLQRELPHLRDSLEARIKAQTESRKVDPVTAGPN